MSCEVIAPALIPKRAGVRSKTDRSDARTLARLHRAGALTCVRVPSPAEEALRELIRTREDLKCDRRIARQRFEDPAAQTAFLHLLSAHSARHAQLAGLDAEIAHAALRPELAEGVALLRCFRGIDTLSAVTILAEVGDFRRFGSAAAFMAFTGLVPSEHSSGLTVRHGSITKTGNAHLRRVLVEAAWSYRHRPYVGQALAERLKGQSPEVIAYAWRAQLRLCGKFRKLALTKGPNKAAVAVARELAGFVWGMMTGQLGI